MVIGKPLEMIIDPGVSANLLDEGTFKTINSQTKITTTVLPGCENISVDIIVFGKRQEEHNLIRTSVTFFRGSKKTNYA